MHNWITLQFQVQSIRLLINQVDRKLVKQTVMTTIYGHYRNSCCCESMSNKREVDLLDRRLASRKTRITCLIFKFLRLYIPDQQRIRRLTLVMICSVPITCLNQGAHYMTLVCPDGSVVAYAWKRQLAGQKAGASPVDRTRLAWKAFTDKKRWFCRFGFLSIARRQRGSRRPVPIYFF